MALIRGPRHIGRNLRSLGPSGVEWLRIPPLPPRVIMTDRADGKLWQLSFTTTPPAVDGFGYITINDSIVDTKEVGRTFGPYDGPYMAGNPVIRLLIRGGYLGYELVNIRGLLSQDNNPTYARQGRSVNRESRRLTVPDGFPSSVDVLGWTPETIV